MTEEGLRKENDRLRALLAFGNDPCVYCALPAKDMIKCVSGFPGCARGDDMMACTELKGWADATGVL